MVIVHSQYDLGFTWLFPVYGCLSYHYVHYATKILYFINF